jgi:hypothetical protein
MYIFNVSCQKYFYTYYFLARCKMFDINVNFPCFLYRANF